MPEFTKPDFIVIDDLTENGGCAEDTKKKVGYSAKHFDSYLVGFCGGKNLETLSKEETGQVLIDTLINGLRGYFQSMKVKSKSGEMLPPMRNTSDCERSHLKKIIKNQCGLDIGSDQFQRFLVSIIKILNKIIR